MVYLRVDELSDIESAVGHIVENIKLHPNNHLRLLCLHVPTADDEMIKKF
jgi:hypothetical protein